ncbi:MAG TPA: hypothetical protein VN824_15480, partial [Puia sp.]|nr:hypothetical protein [Puia sp.]
MTRHLFRKILPWIGAFLPLLAEAQHLLDKTVPVFSVHRVVAETALRRLGDQGKVRFSYRSDILQAGQLLSLTAENKTVSQLLHLLFGDDYEYI